ncbi:hypothetical protein [Sphingosinithalassobacter portus]|uniref:hypothetical protein n=1 Tax=Stakelama portus TaxID=2676234 RepID=UPI000D6E3C25|nr:hypothetical protein [Sphingosinithalassobacter portus]
MRTQAAKRYQRRFLSSMLAYVGILFACVWATNTYEPTGVPLIILSVLPALPVIIAMVVMGLYLIEETDEFVRQRIVSAMLFGIGVVLSVSTVLGFLQYNDLVGKVDVFWGFPIWAMSWGLFQCFLTWRDSRVGGGE